MKAAFVTQLIPSRYHSCFFCRRACAFGQTPGTGAISGVVYDPANRAWQMPKCPGG